MLLELREELDPDLLGRALEHLPRHHDALRLRLEKDADGAWILDHTDIEETKV